MPCSFYNVNGCGCGGCTHFVKTTAVAVSGSVLTLTIPQDTYSNGEKVCICVAQSIPDTITSTMTVAIVIGTETTQYPLRTPCGNNVYADQIRSRRVYHTNVASDTASFIVSKKELCKTAYNYPIIPAATTTTTTSAVVTREVY